MFIVTGALPNPYGKDRSATYGVPNQQLNGEWIEFANATRQPLSLDGLTLLHNTFDSRCKQTGEDTLTSFTGQLGAGKSIRVHSGRGDGYWEGDLFHFFLGRGNYAWNNDCGDTVILRRSSSLVDWASYRANPPEGAVLVRIAGENRLA
jgi:hypothetical protein